ncbi:hypothetical protein INT45_004840 [Circinella minor]|uniref:Long-chain-alcohol oxidase n=1 Tax=Circinella minor TaxID=1195481 RepID=A0A8H7RYY5_9FUNG|nr:hypothetical protein INT45_004840 [Circinella minor]
MVKFTKQQVETLAAIADAIISPLDEKEKSSLYQEEEGKPLMDTTSSIPPEALTHYLDFSGASHIQLIIELFQHLRPDQQEQIQTVLNLLNTTPTHFLFTGHYKKFIELTRQERQQVLLRWKASTVLSPLKGLYATFTTLCSHAVYRHSECPAYKVIPNGYEGRDPHCSLHPTNTIDRLPMLTLEEVEKLTRFDNIIVGSGAGGGVTAAELSASGQSVLVIEKGVYYHESEFQWDEKTGIENLLEAKSLLVSEDGLSQVFCGSTFGGGTTVNWSASLKPQHFVREEWGKKLGLDHFSSPQFSKDLDRVYERIGASTLGIKHNKPNQILMDGCQKLGYPIADVPQNTHGQSHECNWCFYGCRNGIKNGTKVSWLKDAHEKGAQFLDRTQVLRILIKHGKAIGVECLVHGQKKIKIYSDRVVASCGSMNTPGLLMKSGLKNKNIGRHLRLHPCVFVYGVFDEPVEMYQGSILTTVSNVAENVNGDGYGAKIEVPTGHMGFFSALLPWRGALEHKRNILNYRHFSPLVILARDKNSVGSVQYNEKGEITFHYELSKEDRHALEAGLVRAVTILAAAGAREIHTVQLGVDPFIFKKEEDIRSDHPRFEAWKSKVAKYGLPNHGVNTFGSAHQMGSCRLGISPKSSACKPTGETWEIKNLYVADASLFPTASGVNPMVTIEACALHVSRNIIKSTQPNAHL